MKLYYSPGAGALASHITIRELGLDVELIKVDVVQENKTENGDDYFEINPKGYVPYLIIDSETHLSEGIAILQYLAAQKPEANMSPLAGTIEQYKMQEWLTFIGTELQQIIGLFFVSANLTPSGFEFFETKLNKRLAILDKHLSNNKFILGTDFTIADAYAFTILNWIPAFGLDFDLSSYKNLRAHLDSIQARESVKTAMKEEGLLS